MGRNSAVERVLITVGEEERTRDRELDTDEKREDSVKCRKAYVTRGSSEERRVEEVRRWKRVAA